MSYRLGVDVGGTFTDLLLIAEATGKTFRAKTPSTPADQSEGVLAGIQRICAAAGIGPDQITALMHGTTVATNAVLEGKGARVGLIVTEGYRQVLQIGRSYVPGGLAGWIIWQKPDPMAALEHTFEVKERIGAKGEVVRALDEATVVQALRQLQAAGIEAITVSLINAFANDRHERRIARSRPTSFPASRSRYPRRSCPRCANTSARSPRSPIPTWPPPLRAIWAAWKASAASGAWMRGSGCCDPTAG